MAEGTHDDKAPSIANLEVMLSADGLDPFTMEDGDDVDVSDGVDPFAVVEGDEDEVEDAALQQAGDDDDDDDDDDDEGEEQEDDEAERAAELDNFRIRLREKGYRERGVDPQRTPLVSRMRATCSGRARYRIDTSADTFSPSRVGISRRTSRFTTRDGTRSTELTPGISSCAPGCSGPLATRPKRVLTPISS
jgi:hypothetical protein